MPVHEDVTDPQLATMYVAQSVDQVDHHHPLYIHPSDTQGSVLIFVQLQGSENSSIWSRSLKIVLHGKNKLGFVLGTCKKSNYDVSLHELWDRCNAIMLAWIMNTVSPNLLSSVIYASDAYNVWEDLRERFDKVNASRAAYLHKEIATLTQGVSPVSVYFSRPRELWDEYEMLTPPPTCGCPESKKHVEHYQLQKLYQFLTGLNDSYENAKNQVLMTRPLPNMNQAYAMIINVESQRINGKCVYGSNDANEAATMMSNRHYNNNEGPTNTGYTAGYKTKNSFNKSPVYCEYCRCKGHTKEDCFKLHGYPSDFKNKKRGRNFTAQSNNVSNYGSQSSEAQNNSLGSSTLSSPAQFFTPEQYRQILQILNKGKDVEPVANSTTTRITDNTHAFMSSLVNHKWIIDTGASNHMVHSLNLLDSYKELSETDKNKVYLPTGEKVIITHTGICSFFRDKKVQNILHIPEFKYNLLLVSKITKELRCMVAFFPDFCVFQELFSGKVLGIDVWGPYRIPTHDNKRYFLTLVDDYSKYIWIFLLTTKADTIVALKNFLAIVKNQFRTSVKCLRTDNDTKFMNDQVTSLLQNLGILHQSSCVYTPQQNEAVERRHRSILDMARVLRFHAYVPLRFWGECVSTAVYLLNRLPIVLLQGKTPFEALYQKGPPI
uniref:Integrase catalytic domain-containing protein n=1 Tax=Nicotiana tabacum TaxID=4097 RepID=A0A1S4CBK5_TOBAC|nr:PREDICTED: uncharacterized protein LOC107817075 [Nicotiana tabacum]